MLLLSRVPRVCVCSGALQAGVCARAMMAGSHFLTSLLPASPLHPPSTPGTFLTTWLAGWLLVQEVVFELADGTAAALGRRAPPSIPLQGGLDAPSMDVDPVPAALLPGQVRLQTDLPLGTQ